MNKNVLKKGFLFLTLVLIGAMFTACLFDNEKPQDTVKAFFDAAKAKETRKAAGYVYNGNSNFLFADKQDEEMVKSAMVNLDYSIKEWNVEGNDATVNVDVTAPDMVKIIQKIKKEVAPKLVDSFLNGEGLSKEKTEYLTVQSIIKMLSEPGVEKTTSNYNVKLKKDMDKLWKIIADDEFMNAITGNASNALSSIN